MEHVAWPENATCDIGAEALAFIARECLRAAGVETGGVIAGAEAPPRHLTITRASDGGPHAQHQPQRFDWDPTYIADYLGELTFHPQEAGVVLILGRWHKHCGPVINPSDEDRRGAEAFRLALGAPAALDLIVATDADRPIAWALYRCDANGYERIGENLAILDADG